jgi:hypothetical protein
VDVDMSAIGLMDREITRALPVVVVDDRINPERYRIVCEITNALPMHCPLW